MSKYVVYGAPNCGYCVAAKNTLKGIDAEFEYYDIINDKERQKEVRALLPEMKTVPQIFRDGVHIGGYDELREYLVEHIQE